MEKQPIKGLKHFEHSVGQNCFHFVWKLKYAKDAMKFFGINKDIKKFLYEASERYNIEIFELNVQPDHIHLFCGLPPNMSVSKAFQLLKGYTSYKIFHKHPWLRRHFRKGHFWSPGKFFRSVGNVTTEVVQRYIKFSQGYWGIPSSENVQSKDAQQTSLNFFIN